MRDWLKVFIFSLLATIIISIALFLPWYTINQEGSARNEGQLLIIQTEESLNFKLQEVEFNGKTIKYSEIEEDPDASTNVIEIFNNTFYLVLIALIMCALQFVFIILLRLKGGSFKKIARIFAILALIFTISAPLYFGLKFPGETGESFYGYSDIETWGPGYGWYLTLSVVALNFWNIILLPRVKNAPYFGPLKSDPDHPGIKPLKTPVEDIDDPRIANPSETPIPKNCLQCGDEMKFIDDYGEWYCFNCKEFSSKKKLKKKQKKKLKRD